MFQTQISNVGIAMYRSLLDALTITYFIIPEDLKIKFWLYYELSREVYFVSCEQTLNWQFQPGGDDISLYGS